MSLTYASNYTCKITNKNSINIIMTNNKQTKEKNDKPKAKSEKRQDNLTRNARKTSQFNSISNV